MRKWICSSRWRRRLPGRHLAGEQHGVTLSNRGVAMSSNPLAPAEEVSGLMGWWSGTTG
jgi:flagellar protein FlhE